MSKVKKENVVEEAYEEAIEVVKEEVSKMTAIDFAKVKNMGIYYEDQFRMIFGKEEKTAEQWKKLLVDEKLVSPTVLN